jgi:hypothetical protein
MPITTGKAIVALEQKDSNNVDRMILQTTTDSSGSFSLCPVPTGTYDLVAVAISDSGSVSGPTLIADITPGTTLGNVALNTAGNAATLTGTPLVSSQTGTSVDFQVSALLQATVTGTPITVTIPLAQQQSTTATLTTAAGSSCAANTWCSDASLALPAANVTVGKLSNGVITYTAASTGAVSYKVEAQAFSSGTHTATCTQSVQTSNAITVTAGSGASVSTLAFTGCQ